MSRVFISYRRDDSADITGRIFDRLRAHFDKQILFRDVDVIPFGSDFRQVIRKAVEDCQVLLAVIGPSWLSIATEDGTRRLDDPHDFVRLEIETALKRNIPVIPVLVNKAAMPKAVHLPDSLQDLVYRNGLEVGRDPHFHRDVDTLIRGLAGLLDPPLPPAPPPPTPVVFAPSGPKSGDRTELVLPGEVKMAFAWCPPGTFLMGSNHKNGQDKEKPVHRVTLTKGFYAGIHPVTQAQWKAIIGATPSSFKGDNRPVENVSWDDCQEFCKKLTSHLKGRVTVRLPSEAEWEYACRAGTTTEFHFGDVITPDLANYDGNSTWNGSPRGKYRKETTDVGSFKANPWGLFDMHGNVWEWCQDLFGPYVAGNQVDPVQLTKQTDEYRVLRGGSWRDFPAFCRAAFRLRWVPGTRRYYGGFRCLFCLE